MWFQVGWSVPLNNLGSMDRCCCFFFFLNHLSFVTFQSCSAAFMTCLAGVNNLKQYTVTSDHWSTSIESFSVQSQVRRQAGAYILIVMEV